LRTFEKGCASSKKTSGFSKVRTFENRAHLRREVRTFGRAAALHPVPIQRTVAQPPASASGRFFGLAFKTDFIDAFINNLAKGTQLLCRRPLGPLGRFGSMRLRHWGGLRATGPQKKEPCLDLARLRLGEIYSLWLYRFS